MLPRAFQPHRYEALLQAKIEVVMPQFADLGAPAPMVYPSPKGAFRMRAEFRVWHEGDDLNFVMFDPLSPSTPVIVTDFPIASSVIQRVMPRLKIALQGSAELRHKLFQVEFLSTLSGDLLVTLIYHKKLDDEWERLSRDLQRTLGLMIIGRSKGQKVTLYRDWVEETLTVDGDRYHYKQPDQAFTQPNATVNESMLSWAVNRIATSQHDLLELYCGIGNFTIPLSKKFRRVLATEVSKVATRAAVDNVSVNGVTNVAFARLSAEEITQALNGVRAFRRLHALPVPLSDYQLNTVFVDPPRAGLDGDTLTLVKNINEILYISCNPLTLLDNLSVLTDTHSIEAVAFFDQFPYTQHLECGVHLKRRIDNETTE